MENCLIEYWTRGDDDECGPTTNCVGGVPISNRENKAYKTGEISDFSCPIQS